MNAMEVYVVLSKDQFDKVHVIAVFEKEHEAIGVVSQRIRNMPDYECWYVESVLC